MMHTETQHRITWPNGSSDNLRVGLDRIYSQVGQGWTPLLYSLVTDLFALGWDGHLNQVKEKFGGLRFYTGAISDEMFDRIGKAEEESFKTCEMCGEPGQVRGTAWLMTRCDKCWDKEKEEWL